MRTLARIHPLPPTPRTRTLRLLPLLLSLLLSACANAGTVRLVADQDQGEQGIEVADSRDTEVEEADLQDPDLDDTEIADETDGEQDTQEEEEIDWGERVLPPVFPWPKLTVKDSDPFNKDFPCEADAYYPGNSTKEGALKMNPGDCLTNMTVCDFNRQDWYYTDIKPGNTLVLWGLKTYPEGLPTPTRANKSSPMYTPVHIFWDAKMPSTYHFYQTIADVGYNRIYTFCTNQGPLVESFDSFPTGQVLPVGYFTFDLPKKTQNTSLLPTCFLNNPDPKLVNTTPYLVIAKLVFPNPHGSYRLRIASSQYNAVEFLSSCSPNAERLGCFEDVIFDFAPEDRKPACVLVGIATNEAYAKNYMYLEEREAR